MAILLKVYCHVFLINTEYPILHNPVVADITIGIRKGIVEMYLKTMHQQGCKIWAVRHVNRFDMDTICDIVIKFYKYSN